MIWVWVKRYRPLPCCSIIKTARVNLRAIVVCPTTLMYNWENEMKKFTPSLTSYIHHGRQRTRDKNNLKIADMIITTYGTLRSDIQVAG